MQTIRECSVCLDLLYLKRGFCRCHPPTYRVRSRAVRCVDCPAASDVAGIYSRYS